MTTLCPSFFITTVIQMESVLSTYVCMTCVKYYIDSTYSHYGFSRRVRSYSQSHTKEHAPLN